MPNSIVQVRGVSKAYRRDSMSIPVLRDISLEVPEGEFLGLMGPSGSGKTTLLNLIAGIDRPDAGSVSLAGHAHRLRVPVLQLDPRAHRLRERRAAAPPDVALEGRAEKARRDGAHAGRPRRPDAPLSAPALWRPGAAGRHRAGHRHRSDDPRGRRADVGPR